MSAPVTETPAQRVERVKREKAPWSILDDIRRYARDGHDTQGDGGGVRGGAAPFFMMRLRTPNGVLTARQAAKVADLSDRFAQSSLDITVRQNFQLAAH